MEKHKKKALEEDCLCSGCIFRFQCFTQERVFSDPIYQGLFEALMAQGKSKEEALDEVTNEIKLRMTKPLDISDGIIPYIAPPFTSYPPPSTIPPPGTSWEYNDGGNYAINDKGVLIYTMHNGKEVRWSCK